jgi:hypothetical protein
MCFADLPTKRPTPLPQDYHRLGWTTFLRHTIAYLLPRRVERSTRTLLPRLQTLSVIGFDIVALLRVREYQPVVHRLRLSASP